ncbi:hypothetical protein [Yinghuangia seranimata]|uniref:hypothetical protein n=1 Tax=Yinghuangia seranimata TaxID=408067 RepID=UPI00248D15CC|nr:hypothetical protein [Yinghuangia seranimata]MDI2126726.1 hypothetical protein [Yinghuangia seranimata]
MSRRRVRAALVTVACVGALTTAAAPATAQHQQPSQYTAKQVRHFLTHFYGNTGPTAWEREHLVSDDLKDRAEHAPPGFDLIICHSHRPKSIEIGPVTTAQSAGVGWATVFLGWGPHQEISAFTAYVDLDTSRPLKLLDVNCDIPETP